MKTLDDFLRNDWPGSEASFAALLADTGEVAVGQQHVNRVRRGVRKASPLLALRIEAATGGVVSRAVLRPDLWGQKVDLANASGLFRKKQTGTAMAAKAAAATKMRAKAAKRPQPTRAGAR